MRSLTLIRHAKSSHDQRAMPDHLRPLNPRGRRDAPAMGRHLAAAYRFAPNLIISSPAVRTITTARLMAETISYDEFSIRQDERIYEAPVSALVEVIREQAETVQHLCLIGHNPGTENLANWLCGNRVVSEVVTCAVIMLELDIASWDRTAAGKAVLKEYLYPALLGEVPEGDG